MYNCKESYMSSTKKHRIMYNKEHYTSPLNSSDNNKEPLKYQRLLYILQVIKNKGTMITLSLFDMLDFYPRFILSWSPSALNIIKFSVLDVKK
jgi:hypothetical protein